MDHPSPIDYRLADHTRRERDRHQLAGVSRRLEEFVGTAPDHHLTYP